MLAIFPDFSKIIAFLNFPYHLVNLHLVLSLRVELSDIVEAFGDCRHLLRLVLVWQVLKLDIRLRYLQVVHRVVAVVFGWLDDVLAEVDNALATSCL